MATPNWTIEAGDVLDARVDVLVCTVATPALATGYGPLEVATFVEILAEVLEADFGPLEELRLVLRRPEDVRAALARFPRPAPA